MKCLTTRNEIFNHSKNVLTRMPQDRRSAVKVALSLTSEVICTSQAKTAVLRHPSLLALFGMRREDTCLTLLRDS
jgi:hypothetical protein